jgi:hypothetical protein
VARRREATIWIFTESGFESVVRHRDHPHLLLVRSRDRDSLASFCRRVRLAESQITELANADYRYRVICSDAVLLRFLRSSVEELNYGNFKDRVSTTRGAIWHDALMKVWAAMRSLQPGPSGS